MSALRVVAVDEAVRARHIRNRGRLVWVGAAGVLSLALTVLPFADLGAWSQVALGRLITAHGIPGIEPFSYLPIAAPWVVPGWLHDVVLSVIVSTGGQAAASITTGLLATAGLVLAALATRPRTNVPGVWLGVAILVAALVARPFLTAGVAVSLLGAGAALHVLGRWRDGGTRVAWLLPPLFLLWANLDSGFVPGLAIVLAAWLCADRTQAAQRRVLLQVLVVSVLATMVTPFGPALYQSLLTSALAPGAGLFSSVFASPDFHDTWLRVFEAAAALLVIAWVAGGGAERADVALGLGSMALALWSQQFVALFAVIAAAQLAPYGWRAWQRAIAPRLPRLRAPLPASPRGRAVVAAVSLVTVALVAAAALAHTGTAAAAATAEATTEPQTAATHVSAAYPNQRVYSTTAWGDYLAYRLPAGRVVFIYGSAGTFTQAAQAAYATIHLLQPGWEAALRTYDIRVAIVDQRSQEASALHELGWRLDCFDAPAGAMVLVSPGAGDPATPSGPLTVPPANAPAC